MTAHTPTSRPVDCDVLVIGSGTGRRGGVSSVGSSTGSGWLMMGITRSDTTCAVYFDAHTTDE